MDDWFDDFLRSLATSKFSIKALMTPLLGADRASTFSAAAEAVRITDLDPLQPGIDLPSTIFRSGDQTILKVVSQLVVEGQAVQLEQTSTHARNRAETFSTRRTNISIDGVALLEMECQHVRGGVGPSVRIGARIRDPGQRPIDAKLFSNDGRLLQGTINDHRIVAFPTREDPQKLKFVGGQSPPIIAPSPKVMAAVTQILAKAKDETANSLNKVVRGESNQELFLKDKGHDSSDDVNSSLDCLACWVGCGALAGHCAAGAGAGSAVCGPFYWICLAASEGACLVADVVCMNGCHGGGSACCPVTCGNTCCASGETCLDPVRGLCCSNGLVGHANITCCAKTDNYIAASDICCPAERKVCGSVCCEENVPCREGVCCPDSQKICNGVCCPAGQVCVSGKCCKDYLACGHVCCDELSSCADPEHNLCCSFAENICNGVCCDTGEACIGGHCCPTARVCGDICCPSGQGCLNPQLKQCSAACPQGTVPCLPEFIVGPPGPAICCPPMHSCCDGKCCPTADELCCSGPGAGVFGCHTSDFCLA